ncbi:MAG: shikimate dehydrogenase [Lachnospiraceae bacterium]|nr:shikimate dehydrogenase [Lachnospiraceae bacterium]
MKKQYYLLGDPVAHSLSPAMHNLSFKLLGMDAEYGLLKTGTEELPETIEWLRETGAAGWNLTMPVKSAVCPLCDELSLAAKIGGAVNTVINDNGYLRGETTDGSGFLAAAAAAGFPVKNENLVLLGTGGAAASILIAAALAEAAKIAVFYHSPASADRAAKLMEKIRPFSKTRLCLYPLGDSAILKKELLACSLLINATSAGMARGNGEEALCPIPDPGFLESRPNVYDVIYNPRTTPLLYMAGEAGCRSENGLSMLLGQGAESFRLWTGKTMPVETVRHAVFES